MLDVHIEKQSDRKLVLSDMLTSENDAQIRKKYENRILILFPDFETRVCPRILRKIHIF